MVVWPGSTLFANPRLICLKTQDRYGNLPKNNFIGTKIWNNILQIDNFILQ